MTIHDFVTELGKSELLHSDEHITCLGSHNASVQTFLSLLRAFLVNFTRLPWDVVRQRCFSWVKLRSREKPLEASPSHFPKRSTSSASFDVVKGRGVSGSTHPCVEPPKGPG